MTLQALGERAAMMKPLKNISGVMRADEPATHKAGREDRDEPGSNLPS
jgi:hypothetical protein